MQGKVHQALKLLDKDEAAGVLNTTEETVQILKKLHPEGKPAEANILIQGEPEYFDPVIFTNIDESSIATAATKTKGSAGPSGMDADAWRRILISKNYRKVGKDLRVAIARMTQKLCTKELSSQDQLSIEAYTSCRLIPLAKLPSGVRPIGIGEVLRRIIGKAIVAEIKTDVAECAGSLQLCAGQKAGCEAAAHAMRDIFAEEETDAVLLVDATNAFNCLNRQALLHNIKYLCPTLATYVRNCYGTPARLFVAGGAEISSSEGTTQGDPVAMPAYGVGILPLLSKIKPTSEPEKMKHVAYADDLGGGSKLEKLREWWDRCGEHGPAMGYHPKAPKSWLIVKEKDKKRAEELFRDTQINITTVGRKYLGGFIGSNEGTESYVGDLVKEWVEELETLSNIAKSEPQAAYSSFTAGFRHKITYFIRTIPNVKEILKPLDDVIDNKFIPAITEGHSCSKMERELFALPVRLGGMGISIFSELSVKEYANSRAATQELRLKIQHQENDLLVDRVREREVENMIRKTRDSYEKEQLDKIRKDMNKEQLRANDLAQMKGASAWLTALPLRDEGYQLNKREFFDALALRYRWAVKRLPILCVCGKKFDPDHANTCSKGGFIHRRHDQLRDLLAELMDEVAHDVRIEPDLQPLSGETLRATANQDDEARLDIAARGFWQRGEMAFFDVRVFNPYAKSHMDQKLETVFKKNETEKKTKYNQRVIDIEHGSFTPVVTSAYGGFGRESGKFISELINKLSTKLDLSTSVVANYVRTKLSFELVRSQVMCLRGARTKRKLNVEVGEMEVVNCASRMPEG